MDVGKENVNICAAESNSSIEVDGEAATVSRFSAASLSLRMQKKLAGKVASREVAKHYLSEPAFRLLDAIHDLLKQHCPKKDADKVVKGIIKLTMKLALVARSGALEGGDGAKQLRRLQQALHSLALTFMSFAQVAYSYERAFLMESVSNVRALLEPLVTVHLSEKSTKRLDFIFMHLENKGMYDALFKVGGPHESLLKTMAAELETLLDNNDI